MKWNPYPSYVATGFDLLGAIPSHWKAHRLKHLADVRLSNVDKLSVDDQATVRLANYVDVYKNERITADMDLMVATASDDQIERLSLAAQDVLITKDSESRDDIAVPAYVPEPMEGVVCGYHLALLRPDANRLHGGFLHRWLQGTVSKAYFSSHANGMTRYGIGVGEIGDAPLLWAPLKEQKAITAFLDHETTKIDSLIAEQRALLERLMEKRESVIHVAVTTGARKNRELQKTNSAWLPFIPSEWTLGTLTRIARRVVVGIAEAATHAYVDHGTPILRATNIRPNQVIGDLLNINSEFADGRESKSLLANDLVTVRTGNAGVTAVVPSELDGCQCFTMLITTLLEGHSAEFFSYYMNSPVARHYFNCEGWGTAQVNISVPILKALPIPIPPPSEQMEIVRSIRDSIRPIDKLIAEAESSINLLREHRSALITAVVTGKVDVRGECYGD